MKKISTIVIIELLCLSMFLTVFSTNIVHGFGFSPAPFPDPVRIMEAEEADDKDDDWLEVSDSEAYPLNQGKAMMVPGDTSARPDLRFGWTGEVGGEVSIVLRLKVSDNSPDEDVVSIHAYINTAIINLNRHRVIKASDFDQSNTYQRFVIPKTELPENAGTAEINLIVRFEPNPDNVSLFCDFVIVSPKQKGHNRIVWNALELLRKDGWEVDADIVASYMQDIQNGVQDADAGPIHGYDYDYSEYPEIEVDIGHIWTDKGGFSHYFDPWDHHGIGFAERWEELVAGTELVLLILSIASGLGPLVGPILIEMIQAMIFDPAMWQTFMQWKWWQGANVAQSAGLNFNYAVEAWKAGDERKAMYFLGYLLHLVGDVVDPHHATHRMWDGHGAFSSDLTSENIDYYLVDRPGHSSGILDDYPIYLDDLYELSEGIYIAGDTNLVDTETEMAALRHGHITQLSNPIHQFVDFAAHEASEWYPLVNDHKGTATFDNWWEEDLPVWIWNYIETRNDLKMKTVNDQHVPYSSRLIFHFEGADWIEAEFTGSWENTEAIDMENWVSQDLGKVRVYSDYRMQDKIGEWVEAGWLFGGPEPRTETNTLVIETNVTSWGGWGDHDCDGWQLAEINMDDKYWIDDNIPDPLHTRPWYKTSVGEIRRIPLLDDPLPEQEEAGRIACVHMTDLASKLCAGLIKHFFDEVVLPRGGPPPQTSLIPIASVGIPRTYVDEDGRLHVRHGQDYGCVESFELKATLYKSSWDYVEGKLILEPVGNGIKRIYYKIDDESWVINEFQYVGGFGPPEATVVLTIPFDELPHIIQYYSVNHMDEEEEVHTQVVVWDQTAPTIEISVGEPKVLTDVGLNVTEETPIYVNALDEGSGASHTLIRLYLTAYEPIPNPIFPGQWIVPPWELPDPVYEWWLGPEATFNLEYHVGGCPRGSWRIEVKAWDNVRNSAVVEVPRVDVVDLIEGVDVSIDPYSDTVEPGSSIEYTISIRNRYQTSQTYDLTLEGLDPSWFTLPQTSITIDPIDTEDVTLMVSPPYTGLAMRTYPFTVTATLQGHPEVSDSADAVLGVDHEPELPSQPEGDIEVAIVPDLIGTHAGTDVIVNVQVANNENFDDLIHVEIGVDDISEQYQADLAWFSWTEQSLFIPVGTYITIPLTISIPEAGFEEYRLFDATAESAAWTSAATARARIILDETPPTTTLDIGSPKYVDATGSVYVTSDTPFELTALDNEGEGSGVADTLYRIYSASYDSGWTVSAAPVTFQMTGLDEGAYNIDYYSTDNAGNVESTNTEAVILDNTPPTITINSPAAEDYSHSETLVVDFDVTDEWSGVASVSAQLDGSPVSDGDTFDLLTLTLNSHTLTITTVDNLGHTAVVSVTFNVVADVDSLIDLVERFYDDGQIDDPEVRDGLLDKLYAAKALIEAGKTGPARNILRAFIRQVEAQLSHHITEEEANILLTDIEYAIEHL